MGGSGNGAGAASGSAPNGAASPPGGLGFSLRVTDYAGTLMGFFSGSKDEVAGLGSLIGLDTTEIKGLGLKSGNFDARDHLRGRQDRHQLRRRAWPPTARKQKVVLPAADGADVLAPLRQAVLRGGHHRQVRDPRRRGARHHRLGRRRRADVLARGRLVELARTTATTRAPTATARTTTATTRWKRSRWCAACRDGFMEAFQPYLTVYASDPKLQGQPGRHQQQGDGGDCTPLLMGVIRAAATPDPTKPPTDPTVFDDTQPLPAGQHPVRPGVGGRVRQPEHHHQPAGQPADRGAARRSALQDLPGDAPHPDRRRRSCGSWRTSGRRACTASIATGESGRVKKKITAIVDTGRTIENPLTLNAASEQAAGVLQYWREE